MPDCGSNSCRYAEKRLGMRVNGPCRCDGCPECGQKDWLPEQHRSAAATAKPARIEEVAETLTRWSVDTLAACVARKWRTDWSARGCYLHLEVSELIEACRGKGDSTKEEEFADVLLVLLSLAGAYRIDMPTALRALEHKLNAILAWKIGAGPEAP